jgi:uncharacterized repeat protein (TIGR03833 family)|eukprot:scaffold10547_cov268-Chaetoceros_neogracile.AAC.12
MRQRNRQHRTHESGSNSHLIGTSVSVIQKQDQGTGQLTSGTVAEILTNSSFHPRGIKVRLADGIVGRISSGSDMDGGQGSHPTTFGENDDYTSGDTAGMTASLPTHSLADYIVAPNVNQNVPTPNTDSHNVDWACTLCTFVNSGLLPECELCQTKRMI